MGLIVTLLGDGDLSEGEAEPTGTVALGPAYGRVQVKGMTLEEAQKAIRKKLAEILTNPNVQVTFAGWKSDSGSPLAWQTGENPK